QCPFEALLEELEEKLAADVPDENNQGSLVSVNIHVGNRYLSAKEQEKLKMMIRKKNKLVVQEIFSNVISKQEAEEKLKENQVVRMVKMVRSGQVVETDGDLLLIGDVNPGGMVKATGNIYIMGALRGVAHAGVTGNRKKIVVAGQMRPSQLRIADLINRAPDYSLAETTESECAFIDEATNQIMIDRIQSLRNFIES
ncbi:MAG TPA: septum site-determining protein MinC, partial [Massilibacterium sp.]|nr:septum site-determining protein MinC [Massilibacterium sp.]